MSQRHLVLVRAHVSACERAALLNRPASVLAEVDRQGFFHAVEGVHIREGGVLSKGQAVLRIQGRMRQGRSATAVP